MMQLATSQRPHPPPVPPRPSRQVVADALKRSPRPPCPTRQAPPPPNTRPWRSEDQRGETTLAQLRGGRTIVYESIKDLQSVEQLRGSSEPRVTSDNSQYQQQQQRVNFLPRRGSINEDNVAVCRSKYRSSLGSGSVSIVAAKTEEHCGSTKGATSERNEAENHRERQQPKEPHQQQTEQPRQARSYVNEKFDSENSTGSTYDTENHSQTERGSLIPDIDETSIGGESASPTKQSPLARTRDFFSWATGARGPKIPEEKKRTAEISDDTRVNGHDDDSIPKVFDVERSETNELATENISECMEKSTFEDNTTGTTASDTLLAKVTNGQREETSGTGISWTPTTKIENKRNAKNDASISRSEEEKEEEEEASANDAASSAKFGSTTTISSDECATVVIIDEVERKIPFNEDNDNIHHQDWTEAGVRYSSTKITLPGDDMIDRLDESSHPNDYHQHDHDDNDYRNGDCDDEDDSEHRAYANLNFASIRERIAMSSLQGLPPLPRSLSGFNLNEGRREACDPPPPPTRSSSKTPKNLKSTQPSSSRPSPPGRQLTTLDTQLAILRKEMFGLRQLDLSLLSQLWSLNESIQEFRQLLQDQEDRAPSPSPSSEEGDDMSYGSHPPPPPRRPAPLLHHHRPPRPPRPLRPPASDDSPSSEEYGAV